MRRLSALIVLVFILVACATPATPAATALPTSTPTATPTPAPSLTPSATISLPVSKGTALPVSVEPITPKNADRLTLLANWPNDNGWVDALAVSPDGRLLATYNNQQHKSAILQLETGKKVWSLDPVTNYADVPRLSFSPDGALIRIMCAIYKADDGTLVHQFSTSAYLKDSCNNLAFFPDGTKVAVSMLHKSYELHIWTVDGSELLQTFPLFVDGEAVYGQQYTFSPDGSLLLAHEWVSDWARSLWLLQSSDAGFVKKFVYGPADRLGVWSLRWAFSPDGTLLAIDITQADMYADLLYFTEMPHTLEIWRLADMT
ncbi:MAG TPA: WD40 repeat domain-containing protein, partial [Anaerolineales bacterium]